MLALLQAKVTAVANAVWSRLSGAFSKDIMHGQVSHERTVPNLHDLRQTFNPFQQMVATAKQ